MHATRRAAITLALTAAALPVGAQRTPEPIDTAHGRRIVLSVGDSYADRAGRTRILLQASTERFYPCASLSAHPTRRGDVIAVDQWQIAPSPEFCENQPSPASVDIPLGVDTGRYTLAIRYLGAEDRYRVVVAGDAVHVTPLAPPTVTVLRDTLAWRFPRNSLAVGCGTTEMNAWVCAELFRQLASEPYLTTIDIPAVGLNPYREWDHGQGSWHNDRLRYFRTDPSNIPRLRRDLQRFYDAYVGRRLGYGVSITQWNAEHWYTSAPREGEIR